MTVQSKTQATGQGGAGRERGDTHTEDRTRTGTEQNNATAQCRTADAPAFGFSSEAS